MQTKKCKHCGTELSKNDKRCPNCNKRITHPFITLISLTVVLIMVIVMVGVLNEPVNNDSTTKANGNNSVLSTKNVQNDSDKNLNRAPIVDDDIIEAYFLGFEDYSSVDPLLSDDVYLTISVKNKTNKKIMVMLEDASLNDETMQTVFSGVPLTVLPMQTGTNSFIFPFKQVSIKSYNEVEKASFKIKVYDDASMKVIETSPTVTVKKQQ